ncbi:MAG: thioredoxin family protein [Flavobacterium nitrogenifigens]|uniref:thioredoxin family protein n=1 Tax=Flavobacterium nitrogenifigens TaxID=1617283 RepID=UPI002807F131|nr:thioredoxin family protein [Flavobacterium nitrogenifigens]MDQ8012465.1 thioredoxin family protein [Flavobacterium nitrogenifigens]
MKKYLIIVFAFISQINHATAWYTSFEEAQKAALSTNRFIIIDFTAKWCGPCKDMDQNSWNNVQVETVLENYIKLKIDVDLNRDLAIKYAIKVLPEMVIIDANGKIIHHFSGYQTPIKLKNELLPFCLSTEFLATELINFSEAKKYNTAIRLAQKYYSYSLIVTPNIKEKIISTGSDYLKDAKDGLKKNEEDYAQKKQKLELLALYEVAYQFDFKKLNKKISALEPEKINKQNEYQYWFLRYLAEKGNQKDTTKIEDFLRTNDLENVITNSNQVYSFFQK